MYLISVGLPAGVWDKRVLVWDLDIARNNKSDSIPPHFQEIVMGGCYSDDGNLFLSSGQNGPSTGSRAAACDPFFSLLLISA